MAIILASGEELFGIHLVQGEEFFAESGMSRLTRREELEFMCESRAIRCAIYRGGTSRGVYFLDNDLPYPQTIRAQILLNILGSPDPRQVDGLGGGTSATSKTMIIGPSRLEGTDVEMLFGQVSLNSPIVDWRGTCGNLTTAVGPFAIDQGLVKAIEPITEVAIYSLNIRKRLIARVPVNRGRATVQGDYKIPGIRGTGARIDAVRIEMTPPLPGLPRCEGWDFNENISPLKQSTFYETCHLLAALGWQELRRETQGAARK